MGNEISKKVRLINDDDDLPKKKRFSSLHNNPQG
jgi:hypothetical protein